MFKIARRAPSPFPDAVSFTLGESGQELLNQFCFSEGWIGNLSNGLLRLGENAAAMHGLRQSECGLLNLVRCYDGPDRDHILRLFEQAAATSSSFCFSTTIVLASGQRRPVFCIGESSGMEQRCSGSLLGVFCFPRFQLETGSRICSHHQ